MSCGIVRVQKMTRGSVKGIEIHDLRKKDISHTNKDIDWERKNQNYNLHSQQNNNFSQAIKERIKQLNLPKAVRKDAIVMAQVLVTSEYDFFKGLSKDQQEKFFKDSYNFLCDRYGKDNVISSIVHLDEKTPHMHFNFVPVTEDGRLSAKSVLNRQSLIQQQTAFYEQVGKHYGLTRGMTKAERIEKGVDRKNMTMPEYKAYMAELEKLKSEVTKLSQIEQKATELASKSQELEKDVQCLEMSKNELQGRVDALQADITKATNERDIINGQSLKIRKSIEKYNNTMKNGTPAQRHALKFIKHDITETKLNLAMDYIERKGLSEEFNYFECYEQLPESSEFDFDSRFNDFER